MHVSQQSCSFDAIAKRFKDYLNLPSQLDLRSDDTIDILGFLAFETVRALTLGALEVKKAFEEAALTNTANASSNPLLPSSATSPDLAKKRKLLDVSEGGVSSPAGKRLRLAGADEDDGGELPWGGAPMPSSTLFLSPPEQRTPLLPQHIQDAFSRMQREASHTKGAGVRNWQGGLARTRISLI